MAETSWRKQFVELSEGIFRELGFPPPAMLHEDSLPLAMELEVDGLAFELLHTPSFQPQRILISCRIGELPEDNAVPMLSSLLKSNLVGVRKFKFWFGIHPEAAEILRLEYRELADIQPISLLEHLKQIAREFSGWSEGHMPINDAGMELDDNLKMSLA